MGSFETKRKEGCKRRDVGGTRIVMTWFGMTSEAFNMLTSSFGMLDTSVVLQESGIDRQCYFAERLDLQ